jgi:NTE family protein
MKGNAFVGVARALGELKIDDQIKRVIGSSAGAIFAGAIACRIPHDTLADIISGTDFSKFKDSKWGVVGEGLRLVEEMGIYEGRYFYEWYGDLLQEYVNDRKITLQGVYERFGIDLVITTTDLTKRRLVFLNRQDYPEMQVRDAVRRSMSIPVFFVPIRETDSEGLEHIYVDGGCTDNFPISYFDGLYSTPSEAFGKTLGFDLERGTEPTDPAQYRDETDKINNVIDLVISLLNTTIETIERVRLTPLDQFRTVDIMIGDCEGTDFDMPREKIKELGEIGYRCTMSFFEGIA